MGETSAIDYAVIRRMERVLAVAVVLDMFAASVLAFTGDWRLALLIAPAGGCCLAVASLMHVERKHQERQPPPLRSMKIGGDRG